MSGDPLLSPFTIKNLTLKNRIVSTSHEPAYSEDGLPKDRYRAYHVEKAKGGVGLTMIAGSAIVSPESAPAFGNLELWRDETVHWMRKLTDEVHDHGAAVMIQLTHMGQRQSNYAGNWIPAISSSAVREPAHRAFSKPAEIWDLERIKKDFVDAAVKMYESGMDGIEVQLHGHLLDAFISPYWNQREDEYGGSHENRMRFPLEVISAIKLAVPESFIVGARMGFDEQRSNGLELGELLTVGQDVVDAGIDFISALKGQLENDVSITKLLPVMGQTSAPWLSGMGEIREKLNVPLMHAAKIADVPTARYAIEAGLLDLVGMTRAILADPYLPKKIIEKKEDQIRPCVGASMCIDGIYVNGSAFCIHNPSTGRELELPQLIDKALKVKKVAVVGGGPGGLEAARVLAERGHEVTLFEANDRLGGQLALAALSPRRRDLQGIIDWREQELRRLGATIKLNAYVEVNDVSDAGFDVVIVATGGLPDTLDIPGAQLAVDSWDVISGSKKLTGSVLVYDDNASHPGIDVSEAIVRQGGSIELVSPDRMLAADVGGLVAGQYLNALSESGAKLTTFRVLKEIRKEGSKLVAVLGLNESKWTEERKVDAVVIEHGTFANADLYHELVPVSTNGGQVDLRDLLARKPQTAVRNPDGKFQLFRIGDAVASRNVHTAIFDAARLCYTI